MATSLTRTTARPPATLALRVLLTLVGAACLIGGSFLHWARGTAGIHAQNKVFYSAHANTAGFFKSAGFVTIVVGLVALLGVASRRGRLTGLAGLAGVAAFVTFVVTLYRVKDVSLGIGDVQIGMWLVLAGGIVALAAGFFGSRASWRAG